MKPKLPYTLSRRKNLKRELRHALDKTSNEDFNKLAY